MRNVYFSIAAQADNLGDIAIRQAAVDILGASGQKLVVFAGSMPPDYIAAFSFPTGTDIISSSSLFARRYYADTLRRRTHLVFAPGPLQLRPGPRPAAKALVNLLNIVATRLTGGEVLGLGRALRGHGMPASRIERIAIGRYSLFVARDSVSSEVVDRPLRCLPDLALLRQPFAGEGERKYVAISLRGDRSVDSSLLGRIVGAVKDAGLVPIFVTQVARDNSQHVALAERLGTEVLEWDGTGHGAQLERAETIYRGSRFVVSDRLHALLLGAAKGAAPIALKHPGSDKLPSTLQGVVSAPLIDVDQSELPDEIFKRADTELLTGEITAAREKLIELSTEVQKILRPHRP